MIRTSYVKRILPRWLFAVVLFLLTSLSILAQTGDTGRIQKQFSKYNEQLPQEKIFVHTDRTFYLAGEIIWFKVYCVDSDNASLLNLSKVAYIEVLGKDHTPVLQAKVALKDGIGSGSLVVPSDIQSGNFLFRAYTNWMKNFDPEFYFHQQITIVNTITTDTLPIQKTTDNYDVQFFPEGGDMVNELTSKVAFRVTDNAGKGIAFNGVVADENNDTVLRFKPIIFGIGSFNFTPHKNKSYKAIITTSDGKLVTQKLPSAINNGYVMNVSEATNEKLKVTIQTDTDSKSVYLFIHSGQKVKAEQLLNFINGYAAFEIDKTQLGEGISHITIFDRNNEPVCERLYFTRPRQQLVIDGTIMGTQYPIRKKVSIDLMSKDQSNIPHAAEMSMAVFLVDSLGDLSYKDIHSYLWMSSELRGQVESPEYYFNNDITHKDEALDNLMLTHGWRRFKWTEVFQDKNPVLKFLPEYEGHIVSGTLVRRADESPVPNVSAYLSVPGTDFKLYSSKSNGSGIVNFNTKDIYGTRLMVAMLSSADSAFRVDISSPFSENFSSQKVAGYIPGITGSSRLLKRSINMQVQNIYAGTRSNVFQTLRMDTSTFYGKPDARYMLDDYTRFTTMQEVLKEYVPEINIRKRDDRYFLTIATKKEFELPIIKNPVILLDGVPQFDLGNKISSYDPLKVKKLEIINENYYMGTAKFDGIASFFTYKGNLEGFQLDSSSTVLDYEALQLRREFYSPTYETAEQRSSRLPDFRSLLYWSRDVKTDENGKRQVSFYTSDLPGKYAVVVQGISKNGKTGSKIFMIEVKKDQVTPK